jgi:hypothetical protein
VTSGSFGRRSRLGWFGFTRLVGRSVGAAARVRSDSPLTSGSFGRRSRSGSFEFTPDLGFVRSTQPLGLVWLYASRRSFGRRSRLGSFGFARHVGFVPLRPSRRVRRLHTARRLRSLDAGAWVRMHPSGRVCSVGAAVWVRSVGRRLDSPTTPPRRLDARRTMGILPHFRVPDHLDPYHRDLNPFGQRSAVRPRRPGAPMPR